MDTPRWINKKEIQKKNWSKILKRGGVFLPNLSESPQDPGLLTYEMSRLNLVVAFNQL